MPSRRAAVAALLALLFSGAAAAVPVIDRVLAVVSGTIVTLSDLNAATALGLVDRRPAPDPTAAALDQLIERTLQLAEMERYAPPEPPAQAVTERIRQMVTRLGGSATLPNALAAYGLDEERLRAIARDDIRLESYLEQRFAPVSEPTDEEALQYYRQHQAEFVRSGRQLTFDEAAPEVRRLLNATRRAALIEEWSRSLRLRADVLIVPRD